MRFGFSSPTSHPLQKLTFFSQRVRKKNRASCSLYEIALMASKIQRLNRAPPFYCVSLFFFFSASVVLSACTTANSDLRLSLAGEADSHFQGIEANREQMNAEETTTMVARRLLSWPGSSPPRCTSKCGKCTPCKPVHVPVPPGTPVTEEYYPEAWRCKCGNKLYMP